MPVVTLLTATLSCSGNYKGTPPPGHPPTITYQHRKLYGFGDHPARRLNANWAITEANMIEGSLLPSENNGKLDAIRDLAEELDTELCR